ncbi:hypothetical protein F6X40_17565 [Paraburkholderia sp. UCT31]|uniref:hypothetical protein n=1 Tax=Paraburkholderia sp. UCT31 TaxID=2615209 RepID=UPI0016550C43|nr:hypothetical protein [Paraburkholderia sp. UCT31]MBC8738569.1 hypothetical protein [Paraburkholderia sp. UCT31]
MRQNFIDDTGAGTHWAVGEDTFFGKVIVQLQDETGEQVRVALVPAMARQMAERLLLAAAKAELIGDSPRPAVAEQATGEAGDTSNTAQSPRVQQYLASGLTPEPVTAIEKSDYPRMRKLFGLDGRAEDTDAAPHTYRQG